MTDATSQPRFIMLGGFLGAGKTTAILRLATWLQDVKKLRVGLITNDQGSGLVDTALGRSASLLTAEIAGGCFCCRADDLVRATDELTTHSRPDVFIAEPVGSCTDLVATVSLPLLEIYKRDLIVAPLTVLIDPFRALRVLSGSSDGTDTLPNGFSSDIDYIYRKQLEEAEIILINKSDILSASRLSKLEVLLAEAYPASQVVVVSARRGDGLEPWFEMLLNRTMNVPKVMEIDYDLYGRGEAKLGWFNGSYSVEADILFDPDSLLNDLADDIRSLFEECGIEVAHLKIALTQTDSPATAAPIGVVQWVSNGSLPESTAKLAAKIRRGKLTINIRAEGDPLQIRCSAEDALRRIGYARVTPEETAEFRPGQPIPIHRVSESRI